MTYRRKLALGLALAIHMSLVSSAWTQQSNAQKDEIQDLATQREKEFVRTIYELTQSAATSDDYTEIIDRCKTRDDRKLTDKNKAYLASLESWSLNRRGNCYCDIARTLRDIRNLEQADEYLSLAEADYERASKLNPNNWRPLLGIGNVLAERGNFLSAIDSFTAVTKMKPKQHQAWFNRAEVWFTLQKYDQALEDYNQALKLNASDLQAVTGKAHCLFQLGNFEDALKEYQVVSRVARNNVWGWINLADCHQMLGNWKEAYSAYFAAMKIKQIPEGYQKAAWMLATCPEAEFNRPEMALTLAQKAIELGGESALNLDTLAAAQAANGDFENAKSTQQMAIAANANKDAEMNERLSRYENNRSFEQSVDDENGTIRRE